MSEPLFPLSRRAVVGGGAALAASSPMLWVPPAAAAVAPQGVHLAFGAKPRHRMAVSWSTPGSVRRPRLELGTNRHYGLTVGADSRSTKDLGTVYHHVDLRHLDPGTTYHYRLSHAGGAPVTGTFKTAPARNKRFRFAAFGDMGVNAAAAAHVALINTMKPDFSFVVGDLCYADSSGGTGAGGPATQDFATWDRWLTQIQPSAARTPWMTTVGNHEMEAGNGELGYAGYLDRFELPGNGAAGAPVTYSFIYGNVGFVALDGNDASYEISRNAGYVGSAQDRWLAKTLKRLRSQARTSTSSWSASTTACTAPTSCTAPTAATATGGSHLFDQYGVDLVVNGHNHCYERTHPMRAGLPVSRGAARRRRSTAPRDDVPHRRRRRAGRVSGRRPAGLLRHGRGRHPHPRGDDLVGHDQPEAQHRVRRRGPARRARRRPARARRARHQRVGAGPRDAHPLLSCAAAAGVEMPDRVVFGAAGRPIWVSRRR